MEDGVSDSVMRASRGVATDRGRACILRPYLRQFGFDVELTEKIVPASYRSQCVYITANRSSL